MPKFKGKARRSRSPSGPRDGGSTGGYSGCDALLVPRIAEYARSNDLGDIDDVVEHLRGCYREYQRKPMAIFRKGVERAVEEVIKRGPVSKPSLTIDALEHAHLERKGLKVAGEVEESDDEQQSHRKRGRQILLASSQRKRCEHYDDISKVTNEMDLTKWWW